MKKLQKLLAILTGFLLVLSFSISCTAEAEPREESVETETEEEVEEAVAEEETEITEEEKTAEDREETDKELSFSYAENFPDIWGKIRVVDPKLASFTDIDVDGGDPFSIIEGDVLGISGKLNGEETLSYCWNSDEGIVGFIAGVIIDEEFNIKWSSEGAIKGTGWLKENESREFALAEAINQEIKKEDTLILIAYVEYGMIEDDETDVDKAVYAEYRKEIKDFIEEVTEEEPEGVVEEPKEEPVEPVEEEGVEEEPEEGEEDPTTAETSSGETDSATLGEKNALRTALDYLDYTAFSYSGLVEQLKYEGYTHEEAVYGVDRCGADWNEQAALTAQDYLDYSSFSRTGLIAQLEFEGFTRQQAEYGAQAVGY
ncbi:MAG: Ltp family lipoprotein [Actinomycetota bacterium]|nr:Ltp family lipoprotein [Actinomycetota bacterium]